MHDVHVLVIQDGAMQALGSKTTKDPSSLKCEQCNKTFSRSWLLKNHQRVHTGERPYKCVFCEKAFADKSNLRQHQKIHTTTEKLFQCGICQRTFAQRRYLMKHATEIHRGVSLSLYGSPTTIKNDSEEEPPKLVVEKQVPNVSHIPNVSHVPNVSQVPKASQVPKVSHVPKVSVASSATEQIPQKIPDKSADHQYLTRQKSRSKPVTELKEDKETKEKKYSEQDLKDFIKSSQKMMEKNGFIFIKQNFESLDTEPTLTEISEVPVKAVPEEVGLKIDTQTGNQVLNVNGKMVYLQMENKPVTVQTLSQNSKATTHGITESQTQSSLANILKGRKLVAKKDTGVRRQANILKAFGTKKIQENNSLGNTVKFVNLSNIKQAPPRPVQLIGPVQPTTIQQNMATEPMAFMPVLPAGTLPVAQNEGPYIIPVTLIQMPNQMHPVMAAPSMSNLKTVTVPSITSVSETSRSISIPASSVVTTNTSEQVIEVKTVPVFVNEKGAAGDITSTPVVTSNAIVSDANWQGIVNINSEQELLEYISSNTVSTLESDQGMTILIQNVESQNGTVMSLDSQSLLSGSGSFSNVFHDQSAIISDVLTESGNITEVQINSESEVSQNSNQIEGESNNDVEKESITLESNLVIKAEASTDSDDAQSHVMLTEANREHLSDHDDFTGDQSDKMLMKCGNECDPDAFSDHTMYTVNAVKCEINEKPDELMDTEECLTDNFVTDEHNSNDITETKQTEFKEQS